MTTGRRTSRARPRAGWMAVLIGVVALVGSGAARAQVPGKMNFQGLLLDAAGQPKNGSVTLVFSLYATASGGSALWTETHTSVPVTDGIYDVELGATTPLTPAVFSTATRYLQIAVDGEVLTPRRQLLVVPYAIRARRDTATTAPPQRGRRLGLVRRSGLRVLRLRRERHPQLGPAGGPRRHRRRRPRRLHRPGQRRRWRERRDRGVTRLQPEPSHTDHHRYRPTNPARVDRGHRDGDRHEIQPLGQSQCRDRGLAPRVTDKRDADESPGVCRAASRWTQAGHAHLLERRSGAA